MIKVFAFEPEAIFDPKFQQALESFGFHHGRLVGRVPKDWRKKVGDIYRSKHPEDKAMEIALERLHKKRAIQKVPLSQTDPQSWMDKAIATDPDRAHGIICSESQAESRTDPRIINRNELNDDNRIWNIETGVRKQRTAKEMAECVRVLLRYSSLIRFIDPYFSGEARHTEFIDECLSVLRTERVGKLTDVEFHFCFFALASDDLETRRNRSRPVFDTIVSKVQKSIVTGHEVTTKLFLWSRVESGDKFHERFVSTDCATIEFGGGLDAGKSYEKTSVKLMSKTAHEELEKTYSPDSEAYDLLHHEVLQPSTRRT